MERILSLKHWQVFILLLVVMLLGNTTIDDYPVLNDVLAVAGTTLFFSVLIAYGHSLYHLLPESVALNYNLFIINAFLTIGALAAVAILTENNELSLTGIYALPGFYLFFALLHTIAFPAKVLKSIELNREAAFGEYVWLFFGILLWPFCIWFIQPKVNRIAAEKQAVPQV